MNLDELLHARSRVRDVELHDDQGTSNSHVQYAKDNGLLLSTTSGAAADGDGSRRHTKDNDFM